MSEREESAEPAIESLRVTRTESRRVLDHQIALSNEIDDRALRTVRTSIVVLVLLVSVGQIAGPSRIRSLHWLLGTSVVFAGTLFAAAIVIGMAIYTVSHVPYGIGPTHRIEAVTGGYTEREWLALLLDEYDAWTAEVLALTENNARWLTYAQTSFVSGVLVIILALAISLSPASFDGRGAQIIGLLVVALILFRLVHRGEEQ